MPRHAPCVAARGGCMDSSRMDGDGPRPAGGAWWKTREKMGSDSKENGVRLEWHSSLARQGAQALVVMPSAFFNYERSRILRFAQAQRWPVSAETPAWAQAGALLTYAADFSENFRRSAHYVHRILNGSKPGDLPLEQPRKFEMVINAKTAKALGIVIPESVLLQASRVIE